MEKKGTHNQRTCSKTFFNSATQQLLCITSCSEEGIVHLEMDYSERKGKGTEQRQSHNTDLFHNKLSVIQ